MEISNNYHSPSFGLHVKRNTCFENLVQWSERHKMLPALDDILNNLSHIEGEDLLIMHGRNPQGVVYSSFSIGRKSVVNDTKGTKVPAVATFRALQELLDRDNPKLMRLLGGQIKRNLTSEEILNKYTAK